ncbi:uncharacterized protein FIESC28_04077 [Fusarium coffeatum]|uniref:Uncharacterized protein n=1 Tax=Fusarium coffeatum TaxID=231269 RepID=A0A366S243_9HYPO|nr:uncharacterized protein FIESC28_04077 [Fusarium coffeatum]RBR23082.1 hypothetical protein FIESC28_04077 [Fusarium coffeatum]
MDGHASQQPPSQTVRGDDAAQSRRSEHEPGSTKRRGRPRGSKNKPRDTAPQSEGLQLRNRAVLPVPQHESHANGDDAQDDQAIHESGSEHDDYASEEKSIDLHKKTFREGMQKMARAIKDLSPITRETLESQRLLSPSGGGGVTAILDQTSEEHFDGAWECSVEKAAIDHYPGRANTFLSVWRLSLRLFGVDPLTLVSLHQDVKFDNSASDPFEHLGETKRNPLWTIDFCKRLELIMVHPLFSDENAFRFIPIIIRWAVICRADDGQGFTDKQHRLLDDFHCGDLRPANGLGVVVERFLEHQRMRKDDGLVVSRQAKLMCLVAGLAKTTEEPSETDVTRVKTRDLSIIVKALDTLENGTMTTSCEMYHLIYSTCQDPRGYPTGMVGLLEAYKMSWIKLQRRKTSDRIRSDTDIPGGRPGELSVGCAEERASAMADHDTVSEGRNGRVSETSSKSARTVIYHRNRSPSILEDGEVDEGTEPPVPSLTGNDYIHESRRCLIGSRQGAEPVVASDADDQHLHESRRSLIGRNRGPASISRNIPGDPPMNDNKSFLNQGTVQTGPLAGAIMSGFGSNTRHAGVDAQGMVNPATVKREPNQDLEQEEESSFVDIDKVFGGANGHRTAGPSATSNRVNEPAMRPNQARKRPSRGHREQRPPKRQNTQGAHHGQSQQAGGRDKNTGRGKNGAGHQGGFQAPPTQPPNGPRAWRLEQRFKGK